MNAYGHAAAALIRRSDWGARIADYDLDGWMDIFVTNNKLNNSLFRNRGGGKFEEVAFETGVALAESGRFISGMGVDFRDLDNDGYPNIVPVRARAHHM